MARFVRSKFGNELRTMPLILIVWTDQSNGWDSWRFVRTDVKGSLCGDSRHPSTCLETLCHNTTYQKYTFTILNTNHKWSTEGLHNISSKRKLFISTKIWDPFAPTAYIMCYIFCGYILGCPKKHFFWISLRRSNHWCEWVSRGHKIFFSVIDP